MKLLKFYNLYSNSKVFSIITITFLSILAFTYIGLAINTVRGEYKIKDLGQQVVEIKKLNNSMRIDLTKISSLEYVLSETDKLSYSQIEDVQYLKKPISSPFAQAF